MPRATPVMADSRLAAGREALEICGLERILEALKLLLSPGGERTDLGTGLHSGLSGPPVFLGCSGSHAVGHSGPPRASGPEAAPPLGALGIVQLTVPLRKPRLKEGWDSVNTVSNQGLWSAYLCQAQCAWFHSVLTAALKAGAAETVGARGDQVRSQPLEGAGSNGDTGDLYQMPRNPEKASRDV